MNKKIIISLIAILAVVLVGIAGVFAYTKFGNNPKKTFLKGISSIIADSEELEPSFVKKTAEAQKNEAIETTVEFSYDPYSEESSEGTRNSHNSSLTLDEEDDEEEEEDYEDDDNSDDGYSYSSSTDEEDEDDFLSNYTWDSDEDESYGSSSALGDMSEMFPVSVKMVATTDEKQKASNINLNVKTGDNEFLDGELNYKNNILGAKVEGAHEKFIALENKDLKKVAKNFGMDDKNIPDSLEILNMTSDEITTFKTKSIEYWKNAIEGFDDSAFTTEDFSESFGDNFKDTYTGKVTKLTVSADTFENKVNGYVDMIKNDDEILPSIKKTIPQNIEDDIEESVDKAKETEGNIIISIFEASNGIKKFSIKDDSEDAKELAIILDKANKKVEYHVATKTDEEDGLILSPASSTTISTEETDGKYVIKSKSTYDQSDLKKMAKNTDNNSDDDDDLYSTKKDLNYYKNIYPDEESSYEVTYKENSDGLYDGTMKYIPGKKQTTSVNINECKFEVKKSDGKALKDIDDDNGIIINEYDEEDLQGLLGEVVENIQKYAEENPNSWAGLVGSLLMGSLF